MTVWVEFKHFPTISRITDTAISRMTDTANNNPYWVVEPAAIWDEDERWEKLKKVLLAEWAKCMVKPRRGRRPKGPGSSIGDTVAEQAKFLRAIYDRLRADRGREPQHVEVARAVPWHPSTLWRWRHTNGWPPPPVDEAA